MSEAKNKREPPQYTGKLTDVEGKLIGYLSMWRNKKFVGEKNG